MYFSIDLQWRISISDKISINHKPADDMTYTFYQLFQLNLTTFDSFACRLQLSLHAFHVPVHNEKQMKYIDKFHIAIDHRVFTTRQKSITFLRKFK